MSESTQNKDVIYIDVEDDITAIIGKVKAAKKKIVALVPPKRTGVLQSAVNLRLLARAADSADKRLVLITGNAALSSLAASAEIPVAKNLHSRPELAKPISANDDDDDVIDGDDVPVGDHAKNTGSESKDDTIELPADSIKGLDIDGEATPLPAKDSADKPEPKSRSKRGIAVPDFGSFRKKLIIGVGAGVLLIIFLIWAMVIAPRATVVVSAKTTGQFLTTPVTLGTDLTTDVDKATLKVTKETEKDTQTVEFEATGTKDVGEKAQGTVKFSTGFIGDLGKTIPANTTLTASNGLAYLTTQSVTITISNYQGATVGMVAAGSGTKYNGASGSMSGVPSNTISAQIVGTTSGGTEKIIKVVSQADFDKAKEQLADAKSDEAKKKLKDKFDKSDVIIESSFTSKGGDPQSSPAIGQEASDGKAKLTSEVTYTLSAVAKDELDAYLDEAFDNMLTSKDSQRVYDNGLKSVAFDDFVSSDQKDTATLTATAQVGPKINDDNIKQQAKGKRSGEVMADIKGIDGVSDVEVKLSPFWVTGVPDDVKKITIEFKLIKND